jgi:hypothetical protein
MTMPSTTGGQIAVFLTNTARVLDLSPQLHAAADREYHNVGQFLADQSTQTDWDVYPQGSFRLGTVVRPLAGAETFDLDMVCQRNIDKTSASQAELKAQIGDGTSMAPTASRAHRRRARTAVGAGRCTTRSSSTWTSYLPSPIATLAAPRSCSPIRN